MFLKQIYIKHFKSLEDVDLEFAPHLNCILGNNGYGKTSLLEAIYCLLTAHSFQKTQDSSLVQYEKEFYALKGSIHDSSMSFEAYASYSAADKKKKYLLDHKKVPNYRLLLENFPVSYFTPFDIQIVLGSPLQRRSFFDRMISYFQPQYYDTLRKYHRVLKEKNHLLKTRTWDLLDFWNNELLKYGGLLIEKRLEYIDLINQILKDKLPSFPWLPEGFSIRYQGLLSKEMLQQKISHLTTNEKERRMSLVGPHRDDFVFFTKQHQNIKGHLSLGQIKVISFYLKMMEIEIMNRDLSKKALFLVDDIFSELDGSNKQIILEDIQNLKNQTFITTTKENLSYKSLNARKILFESEGKIVNLDK